MRIQEHLYQGFFGITKKKDAGKYYHERVEKMKGLDDDLDRCITDFQHILMDNKKKLTAYYEFLKRLDRPSLAALKEEIRKLEGMYDVDEVSNDDEQKYVLKIDSILKDILSNEENNELNALEKEVVEDIHSLSRLITSIGPLWERQLGFIKINDDEILSKKDNIKILSDIFKEEGDILRMEENLLRKIDLKTGAILRKTTLKMRDIERTKDMNLTYREIRHIR